MPRMTICRSNLSRTIALALPVVLGLAAPAPAQGARASAHTVKKGDTFWEIARTYLGDPLLWPQLYKINTDRVSDPHWIYPGQVLKLEAAAGQTAVPTQDTPPPVAPKAPVPAAAAPPPAPVPVPMPAPAEVQQPVQAVQGDDDGLDLFRRRRVANVSNAFRTYREVRYHPLRAGEFYSAGFLTEGDSLPFGRLLGPVTPEQILSARARAAVQIFTQVAIQPPAGGSYAVGDTLAIVERREGPAGYGQAVVPMGLVRVTGANGNQALGLVVAVYGAIRDGQSALPAERFVDPGAVQYQPVKSGLEGHVLSPRDLRELRHPQEVLFIDIGKADGVARGDLFEARRTPGPQPRAVADAVDEVMVVLEVIHVRNRTATVKVINVVSPDVPPGTHIRQVAKLPS